MNRWHDNNGLRVKKVSGSTATVYIFSGSKVTAEYDNGAAPAAPSREYIYAGGALLAKIDASGTRYYQRDHLSNRLITDSSGNILAQLGHSPFGESWYNATNEKWLFTTYERDAESANDYAMARYDASRLGRFLSPDPAAGGISDPQSLNRYSYAHNDPINFVDPSGMFVAPQIYALMRFYHVPMFGSLWNEFDLFRLGNQPTTTITQTLTPQVIDYSCENGACITIVKYSLSVTTSVNFSPALYLDPFSDGVSGPGSTGSPGSKVYLKAESDCLGGGGRVIYYDLKTIDPSGAELDLTGYDVTEHLVPRVPSQTPLNLVTGSTTTQHPNKYNFSGFTDLLSGTDTQDNLQTFTASPVSGGASIPVSFARDINGNDYGTNGIYVSGGQVLVNGSPATKPCN